MATQISTIMQSEFLALDPSMPIRQAAGLLQSSGEETAPVLDAAGELVGVLTQKDCFRPALQASYYQQWRGTVGDQMSTPVKTISAAADIVAAAEMFLAEPHRALPVVDSGRVVGVLNRRDVLARLLDLS